MGYGFDRETLNEKLKVNGEYVPRCQKGDGSVIVLDSTNVYLASIVIASDARAQVTLDIINRELTTGEIKKLTHPSVKDHKVIHLLTRMIE